jgi:hypothetical protein
VDPTTRLGRRHVREVHRWLRRYRGQEASASASQWAFLCSSEGRLAVDRIWQLEASGRMWAAVCRWLAISYSDLPHANATGARLSAVLTAEGRDEIHRLYAPDFRLYESACS